MRSILAKVGHWLLQIAAGLVIVLALLVGVLRLFLPEASRYTDDIKEFVREVASFDVEFEFISAGFSVYGPELSFSETKMSWLDGDEMANADQIIISLDVITFLTSGRLVPSRVYVEGASFDALINKDGEFLLQGRPLSDYLLGEDTEFDPDEIPEGLIQLADIAFSFQNLARDGPLTTGILNNFELQLDDRRFATAGDIEPGGDLGTWLGFQAELPLELVLVPDQLKPDTRWELSLDAESFRLDPWLRLAELSDIPVIDTEGSVEATVEFLGLAPTAVATEFDLASLQLAQPDGSRATIDVLTGKLAWQATDNGWLASGEGVSIGRGERVWDESNFELRYTAPAAAAAESILLEANFLRIDDLLPFAQAVAAEQLQEAGLNGEVRGDLRDLSLDISLEENKPERFEVALEFEDVGFRSADREYIFAGFGGSVKANQSAGDLRLSSRNARFDLAGVFRSVLDISSLEGVAVWRATADGYRVLANGLQAQTPHGAVEASFELNLDSDLQAPDIDLRAEASMDDIANISFYLPTILPKTVLDWLDDALVAGTATYAEATLSGPLEAFPFDNDEGEFVISVDFEDGVFDYGAEWPRLTDAGGRLIFEGASMRTTANRFAVGDARAENMNARIQDFRESILLVDGEVQEDLDKLLAVFKQTPVAKDFGPVFPDVRATGEGDLTLALTLPLDDMDDWQLKGELSVTDGEVWLDGIDQHFTELQGTGRIANTQVSATDISAQLLDEPVLINVTPSNDVAADYSHKVTVVGDIPVGKIEDALSLPEWYWFDGVAPMVATALFPVAAQEDSEFRILVESKLRGIRSRLPYPLAKASDVQELFLTEVRFPESGAINLTGAWERDIAWAIGMRQTETGWGIERGHVVSRGAVPELPDTQRIRVTGYIDNFSIGDWVDAFSDDELVPQDVPLGPGEEIWQRKFSQVDLQFGELAALGHRFVDVDARVDFNESSWDIYVAGPWLEGLVELPYEFTGPAPAEMALDRLLLIEPVDDDTDDESAEYDIDPRDMPAVRGSVDDFALGDFRFGKLDLDIRRTSDGLRSEIFNTRSASFSTEVSTDWSVVGDAQRSRLHLELESTDMEDTLQKLGYSPLLEAESAKFVVDLLWEGGLGMEAVYESTGAVDIDIRDGVVKEVDPAAGRILGLLNVTALPRRLLLDFSDMTADGLEFKRLGGRFRIDFGNAWTCNLGLEGEVADMGVVGRTGILTEDYDQVAVVRPHVSNLAPVSAAFLAGPAIGAATLLITQIFRKPLSGIGESYYTVTGSWDEPLFEETDRSDLDTTAFADCQDQLPELSPEEIQAIEELISGDANSSIGDAATKPIKDLFPVPDEPENSDDRVP